jgi:hypothetical protein
MYIKNENSIPMIIFVMFFPGNLEFMLKRVNNTGNSGIHSVLTDLYNKRNLCYVSTVIFVPIYIYIYNYVMIWFVFWLFTISLFIYTSYNWINFLISPKEHSTGFETFYIR